MDALRSELDQMIFVGKHPNVVSLLGACTKNGEITLYGLLLGLLARFRGTGRMRLIQIFLAIPFYKFTFTSPFCILLVMNETSLHPQLIYRFIVGSHCPIFQEVNILKSKYY